jgi:hypothetical protein
LGKGIGNTAAHEMGHHLEDYGATKGVGPLPNMDCGAGLENKLNQEFHVRTTTILFMRFSTAADFRSMERPAPVPCSFMEFPAELSGYLRNRPFTGTPAMLAGFKTMVRLEVAGITRVCAGGT